MLNLREIFKRSTAERGALTEKQQFERVRIATCAILLEVAKSDDEFSGIEKETIRTILSERFQIAGEAVEELIELARKKREETVDLWEFTNLINESYTREEKREIIDTIWQVIYSDEKLDRYEDKLVHKLAGLLRLRHQELIDAKLRALDELKS